MMENRVQTSLKILTSRWLHFGMIIAAAVGISLFFLWGTPQEVPMGDSYIHFLYARNLAANGILSFNGESGEGIGTSSIFWVLILAGFARLGISPVIISIVLGIVILSLCGILLYNLALFFVVDKTKPESL